MKSESCDLETATIAMGMKHEGENKVTENLYVGPSPPWAQKVLLRKKGTNSYPMKWKDLEKIKAASLGTEAPQQKL